MKRFLIILSLALAAAACHQPEYVKPTAERQGITSLTAYFTFGPFVDQEMAKLNISDPEQSRFVIPVPYYYPESSFDETEIYMIKARINAELQPNCKIEPGLNILDLTEENEFTYTDASGNSRKIVITGTRVHSNKAQLLTFDIVDPPISGIVDQDQRKVSLVSADDLSAAVATVSISAHATISPDPSEPHDYNNGITFTVTAGNGVDKTEYTIVKEVPEKIDYGFNSSTIKQLFNLDPVSNFGMPAYNQMAKISMAVTENTLIVSTGPGNPLTLFNKLTGAMTGTIDTSAGNFAGITSDEAGNVLACPVTAGNADVNLVLLDAASGSAIPYYSFNNSESLPLGHKIRVIGDLKGDAQIVLTLEGVDGVTQTSKFWVLKVEGGSVVSAELKDASAAGLVWGSAPVNGTAICGASVNPSDGWLGACYDPNVLTWVKADGSAGATASTGNGNSWGWNYNCFDSKQFNNAKYLAGFVVSHFPHWGIGPRLYLYDITNPAGISGDFESCGALVMSNTNVGWFQKGDAGVAAGDVLIAPSSDGFMLYIYYYDHNSQVIGGYSADCIKR